MTFSTAGQASLTQTHQANLLTSLTHRLEAARAHQDQQLVAALQQEQEQLSTVAHPASASSRLEQVWMGFAETLSDWTKVQIEQTTDSQGNPGWYVYNPQAGEAMFTKSQDEMNQWIKSSYWGK